MWLAELILLPVRSPPARRGAPCQLRAHLSPLLPAPGVMPGRWLLELLPQPWRSTSTRQRSRGTRARSPGRESRAGNGGGAAGEGHRPLGHCRAWAPPEPAQGSGTPRSASCPRPGCTVTSCKNQTTRGSDRTQGMGGGRKAPATLADRAPQPLAPQTCTVPALQHHHPFPCAQEGAPGFSSKDRASVPAVLYCSCLPALTSPVSPGFMLHINILPEPPAPRRALLMTPDPSEQRGVTPPQPPAPLQTQIRGISTQK